VWASVAHTLDPLPDKVTVTVGPDEVTAYVRQLDR
jgi:hypothetical protein